SPLLRAANKIPTQIERLYTEAQHVIVESRWLRLKSHELRDGLKADISRGPRSTRKRHKPSWLRGAWLRGPAISPEARVDKFFSGSSRLPSCFAAEPKTPEMMVELMDRGFAPVATIFLIYLLAKRHKPIALHQHRDINSTEAGRLSLVGCQKQHDTN